MNENFFIVHIIVLVIVTIITCIATALFSAEYYNDTYVDKNDDKRRKPKWLFISLLLFLILFGEITWLVKSANQPWRMAYTSLHEIKDVTWPDQSKVQMFTCDGVHHNVTSMFGRVVDEKEWVIRRVQWASNYLGVSYSNSDRCMVKDHYFLEHRNDESTTELLEEAKAE